MRKSLFTVTLLALAALSVGPLQAENIALSGSFFGPTGITGVTDDLASTTEPGIPVSSPDAARLNDGVIGGNGSTSTQTNTYTGYNVSVYNWVGISFSSTVTADITSLSFYTYRFSDGGWFSRLSKTYSGTTPALTNGVGGDLEVPEVQTTTDGGATWTVVSGVSSDYTTALLGDVTGDQSLATFTFTLPLTGINGIRLAGYGGGAQHIVAAQEIEVNAVPEPSTYALLGFGALALVVLRRRALKI